MDGPPARHTVPAPPADHGYMVPAPASSIRAKTTEASKLFMFTEKATTP